MGLCHIIFYNCQNFIIYGCVISGVSSIVYKDTTGCKRSTIKFKQQKKGRDPLMIKWKIMSNQM